MARLRWVKSPEQLKQAAEQSPEFLESSVRSIRCVYETDAALAAAVVPRPLVPDARPEVCVTFSHVAMHLSPELTIEIGSAIFGVRARYDGVPGTYLLTMPMTTEQAVVPGRETFGEPKKIAQIDFRRDGDRVSARVSRMGIPYLAAQGALREELGARRFSEYGYCVKAFPSCEKGKAFDQDPLLVRLEWKHRHENAWRLDGELVLTESPFDPVADLPLRRLLRLEYEEGHTESNGRALAGLPGATFLPFLHGRYDDPAHPGIEIPL
jgi:acetoacetate decarboxylase